ncbi:hypothetical protein ISCGN_032033 [Ixodes scapularis]
MCSLERSVRNKCHQMLGCQMPGFPQKHTRFSGGTAVLVRKRGDIAVVDRDLGDDGRCATADCLIGDQLIRFISVYAPNSLSERRVFFETMRHMLDTPGDIVLGGDFNCVLSSTDRAGGVTGKDSSATTLRDVLRDNDLVDVTSGFPGFMPRYTRWQGGSHARLDRLYVSGGLLAGASSYSVKMVAFSDHGLVTTELKSDVATKRRVRGSWKMNMAILDSQEFSARVQQRLENFGRVVDACTWEAFKEELRELAEAFSHTRATEARQEEQALTGTLRIILEEEEKRPGTFAEDIRYCKTRLQEMMEERLRGAQVRSRELNLEGETQPTKIFRTFERKRAQANHISNVRYEGHLVSGQEEVAAAFESHYKRLFSKQECDTSTHHTYLQELAAVPDDIKDLINAPIRESEVRRAIKKLSGNKAPGPDGIGAEFYKSYLGAPIGERGPTVEKWRQKTNAIQAKLSPWLGRRLSLFNRAYVCNSTSYPAVLYWAQAAVCPESTANRIHRSWASFIWRSTMERTRRSNLFLSLAAGGLGLVNVVLKLHVQRFLLFRDRRDPLFLSALHYLGYPYLSRWMVSTTGRTTRGAGLRFYAEIAASVEFFLVHFSWEYLLAASRKTLYWDTLAIVLPVPLYRMETVPLCAAGLFKRVRRFPVPASTKDFFVRLHLEVLPVKVWLAARGVFVPWSTNCDLCGAINQD